MITTPESSRFRAWQCIIEHWYNRYSAIRVGGFLVKAPYWMNNLKSCESGACGPFSGKALPEEIEYAAEIARRESGSILKSEAEARNFLETARLGIDCSGYVYHILTSLIRYELRLGCGQNRTPYPDELLIGIDDSGRLRRMPARVLTAEPNAVPINLPTVNVGDLVRWSGGTHVAIVLSRFEDAVQITHSRKAGSPNGPKSEWLPLDRHAQQFEELDELAFWRVKSLHQLIPPIVEKGAIVRNTIFQEKVELCSKR